MFDQAIKANFKMALELYSNIYDINAGCLKKSRLNKKKKYSKLPEKKHKTKLAKN